MISLQKSDEFAQNVHFFHFSDIIYMSVLKIIMIISSTNEITNKNYMRHGRCDFITEFQVISLVGWGYSWLGDHLGIISPVLILKKRGTDVRVVVVGLSCASRVFLRFSSLCKINISLTHLSYRIIIECF